VGVEKVTQRNAFRLRAYPGRFLFFGRLRRYTFRPYLRLTLPLIEGGFDPVLKRYNKGVRIRFLPVLLSLLTAFSLAQDSPDKATPAKTAPDKAAPAKPAADKTTEGSPEAEESSSRATRTDISPPPDDEKNHPGSKTELQELGLPDIPDNPEPSDVQEFHPWNPMKARKDIEVGNYYFNRKNYKAALDRYKEALYYKDGDAVASYRLAVCEEKVGDKEEAKKYYAQYLKVLPEGPLAKDAQASLIRLAKAR
jgi:tetratricopeptide (TPR) repeat protein